MSFARTHTLYCAVPWAGGRDVEVLCGRILKNPVAVGGIDYGYDTEAEISTDCPKCNKAAGSGRYKYALMEGEDAIRREPCD